MKLTVIGIDLSFRGPAAAVIPHAWNKTMSGITVHQGFMDNENEAVPRRMMRIAEWLVEFARVERVNRAFIEQYAFGLATMAHGSLLMELGGVVKWLFWKELTLELKPIYESSARKLLFGNLGTGKGRKLRAHQQAYAMGAPKDWTGDAVDAAVIANAGRHELGLPALSAGC